MAKLPDNVLEQWLLERLQQRLAIGSNAHITNVSASAGGASAAVSAPMERLRSGDQPMGLEQLLMTAVHESNSADLFIQPATLPGAADFGILAYAFISCADVHSALNVILTHSLFNNQYLRWHVAATGKGTATTASAQQLTLRQETVKSLTEDAGVALSDEALSSLVGLLQWRQGLYPGTQLDIQQLTLNSRRRASNDDYQRHLGVTPNAEGRRTELTLQVASGDSAAEAPRMQADDLRALLGPHTTTLMQNSQDIVGMGGQLIRTLIETFGRVGKADRAAQALHTSERTMRRRLSQENTSFQRILDQYRAALAEDYLTDTLLSTQQIGELLGFTEATNFRRAFLRWCGRSPHDYRSALKTT